MKALETDAYITSMASRKDKSARISIETPELSDEEFTELRGLQNVNIHMMMFPLDEKNVEVLKVTEKIEGKSPQLRLRNNIFVLWKKKKQEKYPDFESFYRIYIEKIIEGVQEQTNL